VLIFAILGWGILIGAIAQFILGRQGRGIDWGMAIVAGIAGSFVGGLLASLIAGDGLAFRPSGFIGSIVGALVITALWRWIVSRRTPPAKPLPANRQAAQRKKQHSRR
jgi:uncharacterized membrane protein YeaQ/YmgE (transglycosylase-associated protein family)